MKKNIRTNGVWEGVTESSIIDEIEPHDADAERLAMVAAMMWAREMLDNAMTEVLRAKKPKVVATAISAALELPVTNGVSLAALAADFGVSRALLSHYQQRFRRSVSLPPGQWNKPAGACGKYFSARVRHSASAGGRQ